MEQPLEALNEPYADISSANASPSADGNLALQDAAESNVIIDTAPVSTALIDSDTVDCVAAHTKPPIADPSDISVLVSDLITKELAALIENKTSGEQAVIKTYVT